MMLSWSQFIGITYEAPDDDGKEIEHAFAVYFNKTVNNWWLQYLDVSILLKLAMLSD